MNENLHSDEVELNRKAAFVSWECMVWILVDNLLLVIKCTWTEQGWAPDPLGLTEPTEMYLDVCLW